ncbi:gliding motility protein GldN [Pedobacter sp. SYSU D00535]|uniref:type IX secretion system ring protein PorN/GldN n=1 Tax=Pedobacter sp. SYSU D00535 TaxID=2810308 RepID=UPI001A958360|nr:gliding motility protein GldN [Pedobacter sp. SYSU D00535]
MKRRLLTVLFAVSALSVLAQDELDSLPPVVDGFSSYNVLEKASPFDYPQVNPVNVKFYKRIWRDIDVRQEQNQVLASPGNELINMLLEGIKNKKIRVFDPSDDSFKKPLTIAEAEKTLKGDSVSVPVKFDDQGNAIEWAQMASEFNPEKIVKFRIKEDVFYDKQRSKVETRIIGIAPLMKLEIQGVADSTLTTPAFWLYFPHCRAVFASKNISDLNPDFEDMSMDDYFVQRKFVGKIIRESTPSGQRIADYAKEASEQEKEAQRIEQGIQDYKKKVWSYSTKKEKE